MKANQSFKHAEDAVSPVIGVILMVAITVVLAAVVFVLVGNLTEDAAGSAGPSVVFVKDENGTNPGGLLTVQSIQNGPVTLASLVIGGNIDPTECAYDGAVFKSDGTNDNVTATNIAAGDQIECWGSDNIATITVSTSTTETLLYSGSFE